MQCRAVVLVGDVHVHVLLLNSFGLELTEGVFEHYIPASDGVYSWYVALILLAVFQCGH